MSKRLLPYLACLTFLTSVVLIASVVEKSRRDRLAARSAAEEIPRAERAAAPQARLTMAPIEAGAAPSRAGLWSVRPASFWRTMPLPAASPRDAAWVATRVQQYRVKDGEVPIDRIAWATSLPEAIQLARRHHRLVYLFIDRGSVFTGRA